MILTNQQAAAVLAVLNTGGTGVATFKAIDSHTLVHFKDSGVTVSQYLNGLSRDGDPQPETYASPDHFRLAYGEPSMARAAAHYIPMAAEAKKLAQEN